MELINNIEIRYPYKSDGLLPKWRIKTLNKTNGFNLGSFLKSTKTRSPTRKSGATVLPPTGCSFMYKETSSNNHGNKVFVSLERTDVIQISNITFC